MTILEWRSGLIFLSKWQRRLAEVPCPSCPPLCSTPPCWWLLAARRWASLCLACSGLVARSQGKAATRWETRSLNYFLINLSVLLSKTSAGSGDPPGHGQPLPQRGDAVGAEESPHGQSGDRPGASCSPAALFLHFKVPRRGGFPKHRFLFNQGFLRNLPLLVRAGFPASGPFRAQPFSWVSSLLQS